MPSHARTWAQEVMQRFMRPGTPMNPVRRFWAILVSVWLREGSETPPSTSIAYLSVSLQLNSPKLLLDRYLTYAIVMQRFDTLEAYTNDTYFSLDCDVCSKSSTLRKCQVPSIMAYTYVTYCIYVLCVYVTMKGSAGVVKVLKTAFLAQKSYYRRIFRKA